VDKEDHPTSNVRKSSKQNTVSKDVIYLGRSNTRKRKLGGNKCSRENIQITTETIHNTPNKRKEPNTSNRPTTNKNTLNNGRRISTKIRTRTPSPDNDITDNPQRNMDKLNKHQQQNNDQYYYNESSTH
jgi:hypothetical protein